MDTPVHPSLPRPLATLLIALALVTGAHRAHAQTEADAAPATPEATASAASTATPVPAATAPATPAAPARPSWVERPLVIEQGHLDVRAGVGFAAYGYTGRQAGQLNRGAGMQLEVAGGLFDRLELAAGMSVRFGEIAAGIAADRFGRVDREWLPTALFAGRGLASTPYARARVALLDRGTLQLGIDGYVTAPLVADTCLAGAVGVPVHIVAGRRVRIETGAFHEFGCVVRRSSGMAEGVAYLQVPLRVNVQLTPEAWVGVRTGFEVLDYRFTHGAYMYMPLGVQGGYRVTSRVDIVGNFVFPEFLHYDSDLGDNVWFRAWGAGLGVVVRAL